jgi:hypothetical protein
MTKVETKQLIHVLRLSAAGLCDDGYAARSISALIRAASKKSARELLAAVEGCSEIAQHPDFITG